MPMSLDVWPAAHTTSGPPAICGRSLQRPWSVPAPSFEGVRRGHWLVRAIAAQVHVRPARPAQQWRGTALAPGRAAQRVGRTVDRLQVRPRSRLLIARMLRPDRSASACWDSPADRGKSPNRAPNPAASSVIRAFADLRGDLVDGTRRQRPRAGRLDPGRDPPRGLAAILPVKSAGEKCLVFVHPAALCSRHCSGPRHLGDTQSPSGRPGAFS
jgi:hypothetical protein